MIRVSSELLAKLGRDLSSLVSPIPRARSVKIHSDNPVAQTHDVSWRERDSRFGPSTPKTSKLSVPRRLSGP